MRIPRIPQRSAGSRRVGGLVNTVAWSKRLWAGGFRPRRFSADRLWAKRRRLAVSAGAARTRNWRTLTASRLIVMLAILAMGATALSAGIGYQVARQSDERLWSEQRASLRNAIAEFRAVFGSSGEFDPRFVRMVEQSTGLASLKFETEPELDRREMQPVIDGQGRIAGFFTWDKAHPATQTMTRLMPIIVGIAIVLASFAALSFRLL